jgi:hypothetical protein
MRAAAGRFALYGVREPNAARNARVRPRSVLELRGDPRSLRLAHQLPVGACDIAIAMLQCLEHL